MKNFKNMIKIILINTLIMQKRSVKEKNYFKNVL